MKIENKVKSLLLIVAAFVAIESLFSVPAVAKSCNAASSQGRGGLSCGPAPVTSNSQATGQVTGTKPSQVGAQLPLFCSDPRGPLFAPITTTSVLAQLNVFLRKNKLNEYRCPPLMMKSQTT